jgi:hypothetical protein
MLFQDAVQYNNTLYLAQQNRKTHRMLEQMIATGMRRTRSGSISSTDSSIGSEVSDGPNIDAILAAHKALLTNEFDRWVKDKGKPVRKTRGRSGKTEEDAVAFFGDHLDEKEGTPAGLIGTLADMSVANRVNLFLAVSKAYAKNHPDAKGTQSIAGNRRGQAKGKVKAPARGRRGAEEEGENEGEEHDDDSRGTEEIEDDILPDQPQTPGSSRRGGAVTIDTTHGPRHPASSFSAEEDSIVEPSRKRKRAG